jgi:hypothetical protein
MDKIKVAGELVRLAKDLVSAYPDVQVIRSRFPIVRELKQLNDALVDTTWMSPDWDERRRDLARQKVFEVIDMYLGELQSLKVFLKKA